MAENKKTACTTSGHFIIKQKMVIHYLLTYYHLSQIKIGGQSL